MALAASKIENSFNGSLVQPESRVHTCEHSINQDGAGRMFGPGNHEPETVKSCLIHIFTTSGDASSQIQPVLNHIKPVFKHFLIFYREHRPHLQINSGGGGLKTRISDGKC